MPSRGTKYEGVHSRTRAATNKTHIEGLGHPSGCVRYCRMLNKEIISIRWKPVRGEKRNISFVTSTTLEISSFNQSAQNYFFKFLSMRKLTFLQSFVDLEIADHVCQTEMLLFRFHFFSSKAFQTGLKSQNFKSKRNRTLLYIPVYLYRCIHGIAAWAKGFDWSCGRLLKKPKR